MTQNDDACASKLPVLWYLWYTMRLDKERAHMYEQNNRPLLGRILWLIISLLIIGGIVWLILWLIFWRNPSATPTVSVKKPTQTTQTTSSNSSQPSTSSSTGHTSSTSTTTSNAASLGSVAEETTSTGTSSTDTAPSSTQLVATGPGDMIIPIVAAVAGGTAFYQLRTRRHLASRNITNPS